MFDTRDDDGRTMLERAYDPELFRAAGHGLVDQLAGYLARTADREAMPVLPRISPLDAVERWEHDFRTPAASPPAHGSLEALIARVLAESNHLHHPGYVGHQVSAPLPLAALLELAAALLNNGMAVYEMGPTSTAMERHIIRWMTGVLGWGSDADGFLSSGGSAGNLTALLAARQAKAGFDIWREGSHAGPPLAILTSEQSHYSVQRSAQILGLGRSGVELIPCDERFSMRAECLEDGLARARAAGRRVFAVVASACSTATGAFDPLPAIADFCQAHDLWMHVDGAHGAAVALSPRHRHLLAGIERADSVIWDAHKMLLMPALVTAVLFRDRQRSYTAFSQDASYLFTGADPTDEWFNLGLRTLECTKRMMSLKLYLSLVCYGQAMFGEYIERMLDLTRRFAAHIDAAPDFEYAVEPQCNILCFRYLPAGFPPDQLDQLQSTLRDRIISAGRYYLVKTNLPRGVYLRTTIINPATTDTDLTDLLETIREAGR